MTSGLVVVHIRKVELMATAVRIHIFYLGQSFFKVDVNVYNYELPKTLTTNNYTTLQGRYKEEQNIMNTPWHLTKNIEGLRYN